MSFLSYAQNFEDVRLWRALGHIERGCYLDIGAQDPIIDSVSKIFYDAGWRGAHVEPTAAYADALRANRPDEPVFNVAIGDRPGTIPFYEFADTGMSTGVAEIARVHSENGFAVRLREVPVLPLSKIFSDLDADPVHWMKIDVEGMERDVIQSWGSSSAKPWVLVIESVDPATREPSQGAWLDLILERGYREVVFDGLSRYFVDVEHGELAAALETPPNVFDDFAITRHHFSSRNVVREGEVLATQLRDEVSQFQREIDALQIEVNKSNEVHVRNLALECEMAAIEKRLVDANLVIADSERMRTELDTDLSDAREQQRALENALIKALDSRDRANDVATQRDMLCEIVESINHNLIKSDIAQADLRLTLMRLAQRGRVTTSDILSNYGVAFVDACYVHLLQRLPDPKGKAGHEFSLRHGRRREAVLIDFYKSAEARSVGVKLPGIGRLIIWETVRQFFANPFNVRKRAGPLDIGEFLLVGRDQFVHFCYSKILGREPDPSGLGYYKEQLELGTPRVRIVGDLAYSPEAKKLKVRMHGLWWRYALVRVFSS